MPKNQRINIYLLSIVILIITIGQTFSKLGSNYLDSNLNRGLLFLGIGYMMLFSRGLFWIVVLKRMKLSEAYPVISIAYILIPLLGYLLFNESFSLNKCFACLLIISGVIFISRK